MIKKLEVEGLGPINNASVDFANLTIICGKNSVGKTYLSYTHYLLMGVFYQAFEDALTFPTLEAQCESIDLNDADVVKAHFVLDVADINIDLDKITNEVNSSDSAMLISNELKLYENSTQLLTVNAIINDEYFAEICRAECRRRYVARDFSFEIIKKKNDAKITIELLIKSNDLKNEIYQDFEDLIKLFICQGCLNHLHQAITSERTGISLFYKDLDDSLRSYAVGATSLDTDKTYVKPIEDNISTVRGLTRGFSKSDIDPSVIEIKTILQELVGGEYTGNDQEILFKPIGKNDVSLSLKASSGASKSLLLIDHFVNKLASSNGMLIVDEPELNLHLDAQKKIAQLLAALTNIGVKVVVTTHSDHFVREINNLIMLSSDKISAQKKAELLKRANIKPIALLKPEDVSAVVIDSQTGNTNQMPVTDLGIELTLFNEEILASMDISNEIIHAFYAGDES